MKNLHTPATVPIPADQQSWLQCVSLPTDEYLQLQLEQQTLAAGMLASIQQQRWRQLVPYITPTCFTFSEHGQMWDAMVGADTDVVDALTTRWPAATLYLSTLLDSIHAVPSLLVDVASRLYSAHRQRQLKALMRQAYKLETPEETHRHLITGLATWESSDLRIPPASVTQDCMDFIVNLEEAMKRDHRVLTTGVAPLDGSIHGMQDGEYCVLAGRPGSGKTSLACNIIQHTCEQGKAVVFCSIEMTRHQVMARLVQQMTGVSARHLLTGDPRLIHQLHKVQRAVDTISRWPLVIYDHPSLSETSTVPALLQRATKEVGDVALVVYDHLGEATKAAQDKQQETTAKSGILRDMAKETGAVVISLVQMNRDIEKGGKDADGKLKRLPQMSDLRDAGEIEEQASMVLFTHNQEQIVVAKNRYGIKDVVGCSFRPEWTRWGGQ